MPAYQVMLNKKTKRSTGNNDANQTQKIKDHRKASVKQIKSQQHKSSFQGISYVKDMEFPADGSGRVIVRLERLMGSDRIRITDHRYMALLLQRLTEEEEITWQKRTRERRKAERERFRQLVIDGYTEPRPGMEDLFNHPVFRVNRILNRLNRLDLQVSPITTLPPIIPTDPFEFDDSGRVFRRYSGHFPFGRADGKSRRSSTDGSGLTSSTPLERLVSSNDVPTSMISEKEKNEENINEHAQRSDYEDSESIKGEFHSRIELSGDSSTPSPKSPTPKNENKADTSARIAKNNDEIQAEADGPKVLTIQELQKKYGVAQKANLAIQWKPYQSEVVETLFRNEKRGLRDLYEMGTNIISMYDRQQQATDDYIKSLHNTSGKTRHYDQKSDTLKDEEVLPVPDEIDDDDVPPLTSPYTTETDGPPTWDTIENTNFDQEDQDEREGAEEDEDIWNVSDLELPEDE